MAELKSMQDQSKADKDKSGVEFEKRINPDGSYVEFTTDHQNKRGEIREYDAQGNCVNSTYFRLS